MDGVPEFDREERGRWMVIRRTSGKVVELSTVFVSANTKPRRNRRKGTTTAQKQDENERDCVKRLARTLNANFSHGDVFLTVKYDDDGWADLARRGLAGREEGQNVEDAVLAAAEHDCQLYLRRLRRVLKGQGEELRAVTSVSDMDGETGEFVRPHMHIVIPRMAFEEAAKCWSLGSVEYQILKDQDDYTPLAAYICNQARRRPDAKKYSCTRNLKKPIVNERWAEEGEILKPDRHGKLVGQNNWESGKCQYIRFVKGAALPAGRGKRKAVEEALRAAQEEAGRERRERQAPDDGGGTG